MDDAIDVGLLSPVSAGKDSLVSDAAVVAAMVKAEVALAQTLRSVDAAPVEPVDAFVQAAAGFTIDPGVLALEAVKDGNPVIALVRRLRALVADVPDGPGWVHHGVTSQDTLDTALALVAWDAMQQAKADLDLVVQALAAKAQQYRDTPAAARTLTQQAVPTTVGARFADWLVQVADARDDLLRSGLPAQLGGAAGTIATLTEEVGLDIAARIPAAYSQALGLPFLDAPYHVRRTAITRLGDALGRTLDALGRIGLDVATLARTEIAELAESTGGVSSAMPQKQNPARAILIRSAALRGPGLVSTLHVAAANAVDERPDGAWHAEWPTLRELLRLVLGASSLAADLAEGLVVNEQQVARNLQLGGGTIMGERIMLSMGPFLGAAKVQELLVRAGAGEDLATLFANEPALLGMDMAPILDPRGYLGFTGALVDRALLRARS